MGGGAAEGGGGWGALQVSAASPCVCGVQGNQVCYTATHMHVKQPAWMLSVSGAAMSPWLACFRTGVSPWGAVGAVRAGDVLRTMQLFPLKCTNGALAGTILFGDTTLCFWELR